MKDLYVYINEGILNDIDNTISKTDSFINAANVEFEKLQAAATNPKMYNKTKSRHTEDYRIGFKAPNLLRMLGDTKNDLITVVVVRDNYRNKWEFLVLLHSNTGAIRHNQCAELSMPLTAFDVPASKFINTYVVPVFKDINSLKEFMKNSNTQLHEASLLDIDGTMTEIDEISKTITKEFNDLKKYLSERKNWEKASHILPKRNDYFTCYSCKPWKTCKEFLKLYFNEDALFLMIEVTEDVSRMQWHIRVMSSQGQKLNPDLDVIKLVPIESKGTRKQSFDNFFKKYLLPKFEDIETFVNWIKDN